MLVTLVNQVTGINNPVSQAAPGFFVESPFHPSGGGADGSTPASGAGGSRFDSGAPDFFNFRPRGPVWSGRHPVKVEVVGSNPIGDAENGY